MLKQIGAVAWHHPILVHECRELPDIEFLLFVRVN